ncbi:MAG: hypothetical protein HOA15_04840 [Candidatus Marinimicrobia bacterium]|jgi:UDP-N-acetylglucosamine diphosphorylase/glucosamine-1-phosphate N-acetyltransferase|nr:hypothetical protein [Candidatus Neomarinimicrobiota bacterium]MBT3675688.1 hypothetical protein [Candidatus Neomarinimicrobiota bacterium]MBT3763728.1 hypothetical protein [Candidatus Neomarinimicrobiota bacterium]MBT4068356.1 hypothetical protein [Candidatus Neomarinimicrobiota bacterium]MBT4271061.1 hypothetical protein [Candidatus Neomarinimicrobiota bacterium]
MNIYVYEDQSALNFDPISLTRASFDIRIGAETFLERIQSIFPDEKISLFVRDELKDVTAERHPGLAVNPNSVEDGLWLLGNVIWDETAASLFQKEDIVFYSNQNIIGANLSKNDGNKWIKMGGPNKTEPPLENKIEFEAAHCQYLWNILGQISQTIFSESQQFQNKFNASKYPNAVFMNEEQVFVGDATIQPTTLINAENGPVIIDDGVLIYGQTYLEGPLYVGPGSVIKPFTQLKNSIIGPECKIGGEVDTVIIQGFTNKVHDGHLGDSFLGEWVNLGAGTQNSNLKNNYASVKVQVNDKSVDTKSLHIGCFMGDHVKTAIGTVINTGTLIGPGAMIATDGFPPKTIRPFTWYVNGKHRKVMLDKFIETAYHVKERRGQELTNGEKTLLKKMQNKR